MKKLKITPFLVVFGGCAALLLLGYLCLVRFVVPGYCVPYDTWLPDVHKIKIHLVKNEKAPKIVFWAGSSGLFSIDCAEVERMTGMSVVNLCRHAGMPLRFALYEAEHYLHEGDILVLPLENKCFQLQMDEKLFTDFSLNFLLGHSTEYQETLSLKEKIQLYLNYGALWLFYRINEPMLNLRHIDENALLADWRKNRQFPSHSAYNYRYMNCYGHFSVTSATSINVNEASFNPFPGWTPEKDGVSEEFLLDCALLQKTIKKKKIRMILTMPTCYYYKGQADKLVALHQLLEQYQIRTSGRPEAFSFPEYLYLDSPYHMNSEGAKLNAHELSKIILKEINPEKWKKAVSAPGPHIVFADDPARYLPCAGPEQIYETGVGIRETTFSVTVPLTEELRGRELEMDLIVKPENKGKCTIAAIRAENRECTFGEIPGLYRNEVAFYLSPDQTKQPEVTLTITQTGNEIGLERLTMRQDPAANEGDKDCISPVKDPGYFSLYKGFRGMEEWGCWTDGAYAEFELRIPKQFRNKSFFLTFDVISSANKEKPVLGFDVLTGEQKLAHVDLRGNDSKFTVCVPASVLSKLPKIPIKFDFGGTPLSKKNKDAERNKLYKQAWWLPKYTPYDREQTLGVGLKSVTFERDIFDSLPFICDFSKANSLILKNFTACDQNNGGCWLIGQTGAIRMTTARAEIPALDVAIEGFPFVWKDMPEQTLEIYANGRRLAAFSYSDKKAFAPIRFSIPQELLKTHEIDFEFKFVSPLRSPQELGAFNDPRTLGFFFKRMTISTKN